MSHTTASVLADWHYATAQCRETLFLREIVRASLYSTLLWSSRVNIVLFGWSVLSPTHDFLVYYPMSSTPYYPKLDTDNRVHTVLNTTVSSSVYSTFF